VISFRLFGANLHPAIDAFTANDNEEPNTREG
jgi:hypothetical protein